MEESEKQRDARIRAAERVHDQDMKGFELHSKQIEAFATAAMRAPALVAAGGVAASLGFYSANYARFSENAEALHIFNSSLQWLLVGLLFTLISPGLAYFSQLAYADNIAHCTHSWEYPFSTETPRAIIARKVGDFFRWACVFCVSCSIAAVAAGGLKFLSLVGAL